MLGVINSIVGKSGEKGNWLSLWWHSKDTEAIILYLYNEWLPESVSRQIRGDFSGVEVEKLIKFLALVHDIGKITPVFQNKITMELPSHADRLAADGLAMSEVRDETIKHAAAGEAILVVLGIPVRIAAVVGAHHGKPSHIDGDAESYAKDAVNRKLGDSRANNRQQWKDARNEFLDAALEEAGYHSISDVQEIGFQQQVLLTALLIMADWLSSNTDYFPLIEGEEKGTVYDPQRAERAWARISMPDCWNPSTSLMTHADFRDIFGFMPNQVQDSVISIANSVTAPGIMIIEAPMGGGKTEAALAVGEIFASKDRSGGLYFGLPTQATANGLFPRIERWATERTKHERHTIRLAHRMAELNDAYTALSEVNSAISDEGLFVHEWFCGTKKTLLWDFVIGTVDQLLMAALKQKHVMLRHLGLAGKVVVVDECHSYDAYMNEYLDRMLMWLASYRVPVILLSATLPAARREEMIKAYLSGIGEKPKETLAERDAYPLITWSDGTICHQKKIDLAMPSKTVRITRINDSEIIEALQMSIMNGGAVGIVCNSVKRVQEIRTVVCEAFPDFEVLICHAQFLSEDRAEWENSLMKRIGKRSTPETRKGIIVIGTQVLEQSLDIDFDVMFTDLCPMDLLLQRIGRLHRHDRVRPQGMESPLCYVISTEGEMDSGAMSIYGNWLLQRTSEELPESIKLPGDISPLVQRVYSEPKDKDQEYYVEYLMANEEKRNRADVYRIRRSEDTPKSEWQFTSLINGLLDTDLKSNDEDTAYAAVRDSLSSIEVLVLQKDKTGRLYFLPWHEEGRGIPTDILPDSETVRAIARQRLRLPYALSSPYSSSKTLKQLHEQHPAPPAWHESHLIKDELYLFLDENCNATLGDYQLNYSKATGLTMKKVEVNEKGV